MSVARPGSNKSEHSLSLSASNASQIFDKNIKAKGSEEAARLQL